ncbi:MAG: hypothetical protein RR382_00050 [Tannerellaceae bacterium]
MTDELKSPDRYGDMLKNYLIGGAALGGGTALLTSFINYIRSSNADVARDDDDTMVVKLKPNLPDADLEKEANASAMDAGINTGVAIAGGAASLIGSYLAVKKVYNYFMKKQVEADLNKARVAQINALGYEAVKQASEGGADATNPLSTWESLVGGGVSLALLTALGSAVVGYNALDRTFPLDKPVDNKRKLRRIVVQSDPEVKSASAQSFEVTSNDGLEFMYRQIYLEKRANSDICGIIGALGSGYSDDVLSVCREYGFDAACDMCKQAACVELSPMQETLAITALANLECISAPASVRASAEWANSHPDLWKAASALNPSARDNLESAICILGHAVRGEISSDYVRPNVKVASAVVDSVLEKAIGKLGKKPKKMTERDKEIADKEKLIDSDADENSEPSNINYVADDTGSQEFIQRNADFIDNLLAP